MKRYLLLILGLPISLSATAQLAPSERPVATISPIATESLTAKRSLLTTDIYKDTVRLTNTAVRELYQSNPKSLAAHRWGNRLRPVGPVLAISGLAIAYWGLRGTQENGFIRGISTKTDPYPADVPVAYTQRSAPKLLAGVGLLVGALYLIEWSNELTATSVKLYNAKPASIRNLVYLKSIKLGLTTTGNVGLEAKF